MPVIEDEYGLELDLRAAILTRNSSAIRSVFRAYLREVAALEGDKLPQILSAILAPEGLAGVTVEFGFSGGRPFEMKRWNRAVDVHHHRKVAGLSLKQAYEATRVARAALGDHVAVDTVKSSYEEFRATIERMDDLRDFKAALAPDADGKPYTVDHLRDPLSVLRRANLGNLAELSRQED